MRRILVVWLMCAAIALSAGASASAHPLGNFTINHLAEVRAQQRVIHLRFVLDMAEIPSFQVMHGSGTWSLAQWSQRESTVVSNGLSLIVDGVRVPLTSLDASGRLRPGAGGLPTLYWTGNFKSDLAPGPHHVIVRDEVYAGRRIGWRDVIVAPQTEPTRELTAYPPELVGSPRSVAGAAFEIDALGAVAHVTPQALDRDAPAQSVSLARSNALVDMFSSTNRTPLFVLLTILVAFGLGALHAIEPGHGKALLAFTLVGARATTRQAAILAASLTFAHTIGVLLLGLVLFVAADFVSESIYPWITLLSGIAVAVIGALNLSRYLHARGIYHEHDGTEHHHGDGRTNHSHEIAGTGPIGFRSAVVAAMSGGIAPCPAAIVVMLAALRLHQVGYGLALIVVFSLGLASVLTVIGIAVVRGSAMLARNARFDRLVRIGPALSASLISIVGAVMIGEGFVAQGVPVSIFLIVALVLCAIAGFALSGAHSHRKPELEVS